MRKFIFHLKLRPLKPSENGSGWLVEVTPLPHHSARIDFERNLVTGVCCVECGGIMEGFCLEDHHITSQ